MSGFLGGAIGDGAPSWLRESGPEGDVVVSSRVRVARNLADRPFMIGSSREEREEILRACRETIGESPIGSQMVWIDLREVDDIVRLILVERNLISKQHARGKQACRVGGLDEPRAVAVSIPDERRSIMINEEDHLRIQAVRPGLDLRAAYEEVDADDDLIESSLAFAFSPRFGYLTACPTNVGTGVRMSVMLHLPALRLTGSIDKVKRAAHDMALAIRGFHGEGSEAVGDLYQLSNQTTLGKTEEVIRDDLERSILPRVIQYERAARATLLSQQRIRLEDSSHRAVGLLQTARLMTAEEAMRLLSQLRLGIVTGIVDGASLASVHECMMLAQPAHVQRAVGQKLTQDQRRVARATLLRTKLGG